MEYRWVFPDVAEFASTFPYQSTPSRGWNAEPEGARKRSARGYNTFLLRSRTSATTCSRTRHLGDEHHMAPTTAGRASDVDEEHQRLVRGCGAVRLPHMIPPTRARRRAHSEPDLHRRRPAGACNMYFTTTKLHQELAVACSRTSSRPGPRPAE